jgi:LacI family transcriptional regulator
MKTDMGVIMITIKEIAKLAGVSFSTVSKALNDSPLVKGRTKSKVLEIAEQYGYRKNLLAKQLATGKSYMIGLIWQDVVNPLYAQLAMQLFHSFRKYGYEIVIMMTPPDQAANLLEQLRVDGLIFWGNIDGNSQGLVKRLTELKMPILIVGNHTDMIFPSIQIDRKAGIYEAVHYLYHKGHRRIGFIGDTQEIKLQGYKEALLDLGMPFDKPFVISCGLSWEDGYTSVLSTQLQEFSPTAYIGCNNLVTRGALRAFMERGITVPNKISLIGYDELPEMAYTEVPLTTVGPPLETMAIQTVESMMALIKYKALEHSTWIRPMIHERNSVTVNGF